MTKMLITFLSLLFNWTQSKQFNAKKKKKNPLKTYVLLILK